MYGIDYDTSVSSAAGACQKVVLNPAHDTAGDALRYTQVSDFMARPAHNWRRCVVSPATRKVNYYLHPADSTLKENGKSATLTGADGDVMVEIPVTHYRIDEYTDSSSHDHIVWLVGDRPFPGSAPHPFFYTSPGGATLRTQYIGAFLPVGTALTGYRSILSNNKPSANDSLAGYIAGYQIAGMYPASVSFLWFMRLMMAVDYGTFDIQSALSPGLTNLNTAIGGETSGLLRKNGYTKTLGNSSGQVLADAELDADLSEYWADGTADTAKVVACSYRGIENPYGVVNAAFAGCALISQTQYFFTNDVSLYGGDLPTSATPATLTVPTGAAWVNVSFNWPASAGWISEFDPLTFFPVSSQISGSASTYLCDKSVIRSSYGNDITTGVGINGLANGGTEVGPFATKNSIILGNSPATAYWRAAC